MVARQPLTRGVYRSLTRLWKVTPKRIQVFPPNALVWPVWPDGSFRSKKPTISGFITSWGRTLALVAAADLDYP